MENDSKTDARILLLFPQYYYCRHFALTRVNTWEGAWIRTIIIIEAWIWSFHVINPWRFNCHVNGFSWNDFSTGGYAVVRLIGDHVLRIMAELVYDPRRPISIYTRHGFSSSIAISTILFPFFFFFFFPDGRIFNFLVLFFLSLFFFVLLMVSRWFLVGSKLVLPRKPGKRWKGEKLYWDWWRFLDFVIPFSKKFFFSFLRKFEDFRLERNWDWWNCSMQFCRIIARKVLFVIIEKCIIWFLFFFL